MGKVPPQGADEVLPDVPPRANIPIDVVPATRTSSVFDETMQAFFVKSTFPIGEGFGLAQHLAKSEFACV